MFEMGYKEKVKYLMCLHMCPKSHLQFFGRFQHVLTITTNDGQIENCSRRLDFREGFANVVELEGGGGGGGVEKGGGGGHFLFFLSFFSFRQEEEEEGYGMEGGYSGWFGNVRGVYIPVSSGRR